MGLTRNHNVKWVFMFLLPFIIILFSHSSLYGQWTYVAPPKGVSNRWFLRGVHFTSANEGWAVGIGDDDAYEKRGFAALPE